MPRERPGRRRVLSAPLRRTLLAALIGAAIVGSVVLGGCSPSGAAVAMFPLEGGHRWVYRQTSTWENDVVERDELVITSRGADDLSGIGRAWHRRSDSGVDYWLRSDDSGVYRVASKNDTEAEPVADPAPRYVLRQPLVVGTQWQASTTAYLLRRRQEFPPEIRHTHAPVIMTYTIEAVGETVDSAAGRYSLCVRVKGTAQMRLFADPVQGWRDLPLTTTEWYCPGPGLVRVVREEPANSTFLVGGTQTLELNEWH
ncbi:hypothetical protein [Sphaerotilus mobilis]|uniref:DUF3108 domain-containing protein n=1 Tax=Sphaerotilus mobilis TaxID=47994 RepID=A0A4Q7LR16_9BURK|nr:hypothetical protein [Sphaerotilus mobilis]RZS56841.1 hypothetical protein EV685_1396 [Sphaerotilus mobilis]